MRQTVLAQALLVTLSGACATDGATGDGPACEGEKCDDLTGDDKPLETPCDDSLFDRSGRGFLPERLAEDALIKHVYLQGGSCPVTFDEIIAAMKESDDAGCTGGPTGAKGMTTRVVTEQAQLAGKSDGAGYRTITTRKCDGREEFGLMFSLFGYSDTPGGASAGLDPDGTANPGEVEIIAFDETNGVFNFYKEVGGKMGFFGSSTDFVGQGPGGPNLTDVRGCANCHPGGGINMKELTAPWLHWESTFDSPGAEELVTSRAAVMGSVEDGPNLQFDVIQPGNQAWNARKLQFLEDGPSVAKLLEPLFCPVQVNIGAINAKNKITDRFLFDSQLTRALGRSAPSITLTQTHYDRLIAAIGQNVAGTDKADVVAPMAFIERSHEDNDYVDKLVAAGIIDDDFRADVLMVDFTRPVFSDERCDLLQFAPDLAPDDRTPEKIRDGFIANLAGEDADTAAGLLRAHLEARAAGAPFDHSATLDTFVGACQARQSSEKVSVPGGDVSGFHADVIKLRSLQRKIAFRDGVLDTLEGSAAHPFKVFEFDDTLPADDISVSTSAAATNPLAVRPTARLSPVDCTLVSTFTPAGAASSGGGSEDSCEGRCDVFTPGAPCQCNSVCTNAGDCCEDFEEVCGDN
ncbi:MAG TPA: hypothetical protein VMZ28_13955 [Kofleriaceae bacterium]|nr:hypothetical protein [Kofleriaceae bacterium]